MKNFLKNFKYMSYRELRIFWVISAGILLAITLLISNIFSQGVKDNTQKIAIVNKETSKLLKTPTKNKNTEKLIDDTKTKSSYTIETVQKTLKTTISNVLNYPDGKTIKDLYNKSKDNLKGSIWVIAAGGTPESPGFMSDAWQQKAGTNHYSQSISKLVIVPTAPNKYNATVTVSPAGSDVQNTDSKIYWLDISIDNNITTVNILKTMEKNN